MNYQSFSQLKKLNLLKKYSDVPYNLAKRIIVFVADPEKVKLRLNKLGTWLKNAKHLDHIISNAPRSCTKT